MFLKNCWYVAAEAREVGVDVLTFADGLKSILRQDPDVILVGEVRDAETARIAVQSALTGHLVLSSFHATDTPAALHRLAKLARRTGRPEASLLREALDDLLAKHRDSL